MRTHYRNGVILGCLCLVAQLALVIPSHAQQANPTIGLCEHTQAERLGQCEDFTANDGDLRDNGIGNDRASFVHVPRGWRVALYRDVGFSGVCQELSRPAYN